MSKFTEQEKLEVIEYFIEQWRVARSSAGGDRAIYLILKAIGSDIRARLPVAPSRARDRIERVIMNAKDRKGPSGYVVSDLRKIAETTISEWPVIRAALEKLEKEQST